LFQGVEFWAVNTDAQALENSLAMNKVQMGNELTRGLGRAPESHENSAAGTKLRYICHRQLRDAVCPSPHLGCLEMLSELQKHAGA
jgi:cell division protein FtsZ